MSSDLTRVAKARRSVRQFRDDEVPRQAIEALIQDAAWAPSGGNAQPWSVTAFEPSVARSWIQRFERRMWKTLLPRVMLMMGPNADMAAAQRRIEADAMGSGRPWLLFVWSPRSGVDPKVVQDVHAALQGDDVPTLAEMQRACGPLDARVAEAGVASFVYLMALLAEQRGLASCMQYTWLAFAEILEAEVPAPPGMHLTAALVLGFGARNPPVPPRRPVEVRWG